MPESHNPSNHPAPGVSIILPTYNRADFLPEAVQAIREQQFTDWELIIVDDGSIDETPQIIQPLTATISQQVRYIRQDNQGPYGARNTGLDHATGKYVAFYDSDDLWLPFHLADCVTALEANGDVDWVYGACRIVDHKTAAVLAENTFYVEGKPRPLLSLKHRSSDALRIIEDEDSPRCMILHGLFNGLQNSVMRRSLFETARFEAASRNEAEDQLIVLRLLKHGRRFAYFDNVHVIYRVHDQNSSGSAKAASVERRLRVQSVLLQQFENFSKDVPLTRREHFALRRRLSREYFWLLGYALQWQNGLRHEALQSFRKGIAYWPWNVWFWKTYLAATVRTWFAPEKHRSTALHE